MAERRPLVLVSGRQSELPDGDTLPAEAQEVQLTATKYFFTANEGQTNFSSTDDRGNVLDMSSVIFVFLNGASLDVDDDYTYTQYILTLIEGATAGDELKIVSFDTTVPVVDEGYTPPTPSPNGSANDELQGLRYDNMTRSTAGETGTDIEGFDMKDDGTKMWVMDSTSLVTQYDLSTAYDITTAVTAGTHPLFTNDLVDGFTMAKDGLSFYVGNSATKQLMQRKLSVAFDITSNTGGNNVTAAFQYAPNDCLISDDGLTIVIWAQNRTYRYVMSTAYDLSTGSTAQEISSVTINGGADGIAVNSDGTKIYITKYNAVPDGFIKEYTFPQSVFTSLSGSSLQSFANPYKGDIEYVSVPRDSGYLYMTVSNAIYRMKFKLPNTWLPEVGTGVVTAQYMFDSGNGTAVKTFHPEEDKTEKNLTGKVATPIFLASDPAFNNNNTVEFGDGGAYSLFRQTDASSIPVIHPNSTATMFFVCQRLGSGTNAVFFNYDGGNRLKIGTHGFSQIYVRYYSGINRYYSVGTAILGSPFILTVKLNNTSSGGIRVNGVNQANYNSETFGSSGTTSPSQVFLGGYSQTEFFEGKMAEAIFYGRVNLSLPDIQTVENYLSVKYGITLG